MMSWMASDVVPWPPISGVCICGEMGTPGHTVGPQCPTPTLHGAQVYPLLPAAFRGWNCHQEGNSTS